MPRLKGPGSMAHLCLCNHKKSQHDESGCLAIGVKTKANCPCTKFRGRQKAEPATPLASALVKAVKLNLTAQVLRRRLASERRLKGMASTPDPQVKMVRDMLVNLLEAGPSDIIVDVINDTEVDVLVEPSRGRNKKEFRITLTLENTTDRYS